MKKPPSRIRYEKSHPVVSARLSMDYYEKLQKVLKTEEKSFAQFVRDVMDKAEIEYSNAYSLGYYEGTEDSEIWFYCNICGKKVLILPNSESHKAIIKYMKEHGWGHKTCHEESSKSTY